MVELINFATANKSVVLIDKFQPLLEEIRRYTGWLFLLKTEAFLLEDHTLYEILLTVEQGKRDNKTI